MTRHPPCPKCGQPTLLERSSIPWPYFDRRVCRVGHFVCWVQIPSTLDRARAFIMPFGRFRGMRFEEIEKQEGGPTYLRNFEEFSDATTIVRLLRLYLADLPEGPSEIPEEA